MVVYLNTGFEHIDARSVFLQDATDRKRASTAGRRRRRGRRRKKEGNPTLDSPTNVKTKKSKPKVSKSDHVLRILGDMVLELFLFLVPFFCV